MGEAGDDIGNLEWSPGLYLAAKEHTDKLVASGTVYEDPDANDLASTYGTIGVKLKQLIFEGNDTAENVVMMLLNNETDKNLEGREVLLSKSTKMVGVARDTMASGIKVLTVMLDSSFETDPDYASCPSSLVVDDSDDDDDIISPSAAQTFISGGLIAAAVTVTLVVG